MLSSSNKIRIPSISIGTPIDHNARELRMPEIVFMSQTKVHKEMFPMRHVLLINGFASSKPITMFDRKTLQVIKKIEVMGNPDGMMFDPFNGHVHVLSHQMPYDTVINAADGTVVGTIDLGGQPEQAASDGNGTIYVDLEDKSAIAVVDAKTNTVKAKFDIAGSGGTCAGLALDTKNHVLFAACRNPQNMVILNAKDGKIITTIPIGPGTDGAAFNPKTMEAFSSNGGDGTLTIVKEN